MVVESAAAHYRADCRWASAHERRKRGHSRGVAGIVTGCNRVIHESRLLTPKLRRKRFRIQLFARGVLCKFIPREAAAGGEERCSMKRLTSLLSV